MMEKYFILFLTFLVLSIFVLPYLVVKMAWEDDEGNYRTGTKLRRVIVGIVMTMFFIVFILK